MERVEGRLRVFRVLEWFFFLAILIGGWRNTFYNGQDFTVMWNTGRFIFSGETPYSVARDGAMVFKYPPWILPVFLPLSLLPLIMAKAVWAALEVGSVVWIRRSLLRASDSFSVRIGFWIAWGVLWGAWMAHTLDGQISLLVLAIAVACWKRFPAIAGWVLTTKVHTFLPWLIARCFKRDWNLKRGIAFALALLALSLPAAFVTSHGLTSARLFLDWKAAASSGAAAFDGDKVHGVENSGFTPTGIRLAHVPAQDGMLDAVLGLVLGSVLSSAWWLAARSRRLSEDAILFGLLALVPTYHPLPWNHLFLFAWPAMAWAWGRTRLRKWSWSIGHAQAFLLVAGSFLFALSSPKVWDPWGAMLALLAGKSWGVVLILSSLLCETLGESVESKN